MSLDYKKLWKSIKLFFFHLWYGKDAFKLNFNEGWIDKGNIIHGNGFGFDNSITQYRVLKKKEIMRTIETYAGDYKESTGLFEYIVKPI